MNQDIIRERISSSIHQKDPNAEAFLFGSRARGDFNEHSDWDVLILVDEHKITNELEDKFRDGLYDIELESGQIISTFIYTKSFWKNTLVHSPLYDSVTREGVVL